MAKPSGETLHNRGRFQLHGAGDSMLESNAWAQIEPFFAITGHHYLSDLETKAKSNHKKTHEILVQEHDAFNKHHAFIDKIAVYGGRGPYKWTEPKKPRRDMRRVDIEISSGVAMV